jgi:hypothetical protein
MALSRHATLLFLFAALSNSIYAQQGTPLSGKVTDQQGNPIAGASVYLSHTSKGVTSSVSGEFHLENAPEGRYELVISAIGYQTKVIPVSSDHYPENLKISLAQRATEMAAVVIEATDKNGWQKYGKYFTDNFIGTTPNARYCKIVNRDALRFRFSEKNNRLTVKADEPIIIENNALGYKVSFLLIEFSADFNANTVAYYGYPFFGDLKASGGKQQHAFANNRRQAYDGSLMHFMRAVYDDKIRDEHFIVKATISRPNVEKERVKKALDTADTHQSAPKPGNAISEDSLRYYKKVLKQRDTLTHAESLVSLKEMIIKTGGHSKFLFFNNTMEVVYAGANNKRANRSQITLKTPEAVEIMKNGSYFSPLELVTFKYWGQYEKICNMLPFDYYPG